MVFYIAYYVTVAIIVLILTTMTLVGIKYALKIFDTCVHFVVFVLDSIEQRIDAAISRKWDNTFVRNLLRDREN